MPLTTQLGYKKETTYGTAVVVDRFSEYESESITPEVKRVDVPTMRTSTFALRGDRFAPYVSGYAGNLKLPVFTKGFGFWLEHMTGGTVTTSGIVDSTYTHTVNVGTLCSLGFTLQLNRPIGICGNTNQAFTYAGGKVASWTLAQEQGGVMTFEADLLFASGTTATALATASYATGLEFLPFGSTGLTLDGLSVPVKSWSVKCDNQLAADRMLIRNSYSRGEPVENGWRDITFSATTDFEAIADNTPAGKAGIYNRLVSTTVAGAKAAVVITANGPTLSGVSAYPGITITMSEVRIDEGAPTISGPEMTELSFTGKALTPASGQLCQVAYRSTDATP